MSELESGFKIYRASAIPPAPAPVLIVEIREASHEFFVQYFLWAGDAPGIIEKALQEFVWVSGGSPACRGRAW